MGRLDDARRRREAALAAAGPTPVELLELARQSRQQDQDALDPLMRRLWDAIRCQCSAGDYRRQFREEWREQRGQRARLHPNPSDWEQFPTKHPLSDEVRVLIYGKRSAVEVEATTVIDHSTRTLALNLEHYRWALGRWGSVGDRSNELAWGRYLSNVPESAEAEAVAYRNNLAMLRPVDLSGQHRGAVEELTTIFLDFYGIPYSEVEV